MKIAVYGISRVGKDYLIDYFVSLYPKEFIHVKGSAELNSIARNKFGVEFSRLQDNEQNEIRKDFILTLDSYEKKYKNVIVDGHYSFPCSSGYKVVFTDLDYEAYDAVFYLNKPITTLKKQAIMSKRNDTIEKFILEGDNGLEWEEYEISQLQTLYENSNKDFIVLDESIEYCVQFIYKYINSKLSSINVTNRIISALRDYLDEVETIVLTDLDKTISVNDATYEYIEKGNLEVNMVKEIFLNEYYTIYQQYRFHQYMKMANNIEQSLNYAADRCILNNELIDDIFYNKPRNSLILGITTGISDMWHIINRRIKFCDIIIGKSYGCNYINELVSKKVKGLIAKTFTDKGYKTIALGDSTIDFPMFVCSSKAFLICNSVLNKNVVNKLPEIGKKFFQLSCNKEKYAEVEIKDSIW